MNHNRLSHAIALAITGSALSVVPTSAAWAASTTMYNLYRANFAGYGPGGAPNVTPAVYTATSTTPCAPCANFYSNPIGPDNGSGNETDGWVWDANPNGFDGITSPGAPIPYGHTQTTADPNRPGWVGIGGSSTPTLTTPFGYNASVSLNWAVDMQGHGSAEISNADSIARYQQSADIDAAKGAWSDDSVSGAPGWKYNIDFGLLRSDVDATVTLNIHGVNQTNTNYGFTVLKGMSDRVSSFYNHHGSWNTNNNRNPTTGAEQLSAFSAPGNSGLSVSQIVAYSVGDNPLTPANDPLRLNTLSFDVEAGQVYTIVLGGYRNGSRYETVDGYVLNITTAPVPVPAAVWLLGSALAGMGVIGRRKA